MQDVRLRFRRSLPVLLFSAMVTSAVAPAQTGGPIYISDQGNRRVVRVNDISGAGWTVLSQNPSGTEHFLGGPGAVAFGPDGKIYITDGSRLVRVDDFSGNGWVSFGSQGSGTNQFFSLSGVAVDASGRIYVADGTNQRIVSFDDMSGANWQTCCTTTSPPVSFIHDVAVDDTTGQIFFTDVNNDRIVRVDTMGGANLKPYGGFGTGIGQFQSPRGIFVRTGKVYVVDEGNRRVIQTNTSLDGSGWASVSTNSGSTESFDGPRFVFVDPAGHFFVTDYRQHRVVEIDSINGATWTSLGTHGSGVNQFTSPEGVVLGSAATGSARADLSVTVGTSLDVVDAGQPVTYTLTASNRGPDTAIAAMVIDLFPVGATYQSSTSGATVGSDRVSWSLGDLPSGALSGALQLTLATPAALDCKQSIVDVAAVSSTTTDPEASNNYWVTRVLPSRAATEDCSGTVDADCNGFVGCADPACATDSACVTTPPSGATYVGVGTVPGGGASSPPRNPSQPPRPPAAPTPNPNSPAPTNPSQQQPCARADNRAPLPSYCCDPLPPPPGSTSPSETDWNTNCHAVDPNFLEASPAVNAMGYGLASAGQTISYTIHYENIGGADAHGVGIVTSLDPDLDATTLTIGQGGTYASATRTLTWTDPVLPPHVPRTVTYSAQIQSAAPPRTRVRAQATIIFPDAFPPSRTDSNFVVHVIPFPNEPLEPALAVYKCLPVAGSSDQWIAILENRGFGFAYDVAATIKSASGTVTLGQRSTTFSDVHDPTPDKLASVIPLASTASRTPVSFTSTGSLDACATMTWEISYSTSAGNRVVVDVQAAADVNGDGIPDYLQTADGGTDGGTGPVTSSSNSGCSCATTGPASLMAPACLLLLFLVRRRNPVPGRGTRGSR
jgi:uncharacterized repeat protein (TIGR01451 family)/MYXO-CTERM domain-containing protein